MPQRIIAIDAEIFTLQEKLKELPSIEKAASMKEKITELQKKRAEILKELEKQQRDRIQ